MTNTEFQTWLDAEFEKHPLFQLSRKRNILSLNELTYMLRRSGRDFCINIEDPDDPMCFGFIPSVRETFISTSDLARKVKQITCEDHEGAEYPTLVVEFQSASK